MRVIIIIQLCCGLLFSHLANAALDLELTRGVVGAVPIALVPFSNDAAVVSGQTTVSAVITQDLNNSGQFNVTNPSSATTQAINKVDLAYWQKQRVNDVVVGSVSTLPGGQYQVHFQLYNVYAKDNKENAVAANAVLIDQTFSTSQSGLRTLAHHISDLIYQKLTGNRGIFSTKIAYILVQRPVNQRPIYSLEIADQDGFNEQTLLRSYQPIMSPAWSPDGKQLAYVSFENLNAAIYIQDLQTGQRRLVSASPGINGAPAWSPDGTQLALVLTKTGNPKIYTLNIGSGHLEQITHGYSIDTEPAWAPDGKSLIFTSSRGGNPQIYQYTFADNNTSVDPVARLTFDGNYNARAQFLPDESGIVMMHRDSGLFGIAKQNLTDSRVSVLTQSGNDESPSIAPNGRMILYASRYGGRGVLAVVSIDGRVKLRLPAKQGAVQEPAWSPFLS